MSHLILAIDPGPEASGVVLYDPSPRGEQGPHVLERSNAATVDHIIEDMRSLWVHRTRFVVVIERVTAQQYAANSLLRTAEVGGRLYQEALACEARAEWMTRSQVLTELHISGGSRDKQVRARMIELHGGTQATAVGTKKTPGPLYGVSSHAWQALGLAVAWHRRWAREGL